MANEKHLRILKQGVEAWNRWRNKHPDVRPDLRNAFLQLAKLESAGLAGVDLSDGDLSYIWAPQANLNRANLSGANLTGVNLSEASLIETNLSDTDLTNADLTSADLTEADLSWAFLNDANLTKANLTRSDLGGAHLHRTGLDAANFSQTRIGWTSFEDVDLRRARGLATVKHEGPSTIGIDTIYRSQGKIPETFLRGAGVPDTMIEFVHSLVSAETAIDYYSCFISHSGRDQAFAERLHADLQANAVRCWFAPEDMKIGDKIRPTLDRSVQIHDKLLIILSENSVSSDWVEQEVETALARERQEKRTVLFPIRLDDAVMEMDEGWPALIRNTRHIGDFRNWKNHDAYQQAFSRLLRDLKQDNSKAHETQGPETTSDRNQAT